MKHIVLVDDEEAIVYVFQRYLERAGYRVSAFCTPGEALAAAGLGDIDMLVTDYRMPGMTGGELVARMRLVHPDRPALIVTAYGAEVCAAAAQVRVLPKPVGPQDLVDAVAQGLART
jgi:CheY-like chemotaxis protein